jgi:hypothetical protein
VHCGVSNNSDFERSSTKNNPGDSNQNSAVKKKPSAVINFESRVTKDDQRSWNGDSPQPKEVEREKSVHRNSGVDSESTDKIRSSRNIVGLKNLKDKGYYVNSQYGNFDKIRPMTNGGASQSIIQIYKNGLKYPNTSTLSLNLQQKAQIINQKTKKIEFGRAPTRIQTLHPSKSYHGGSTPSNLGMDKRREAPSNFYNRARDSPKLPNRLSRVAHVERSFEIASPNSARSNFFPKSQFNNFQGRNV